MLRTSLFTSTLGMLVVVSAGIAGPTDNAVDRGKEIYAELKCVLCHSVGGIGGKKRPLDGVGSRLTPEDIKRWIRTPKTMKANTAMKSYPRLLEKDLNDLAAFLQTLR